MIIASLLHCSLYTAALCTLDFAWLGLCLTLCMALLCLCVHMYQCPCVRCCVFVAANDKNTMHSPAKRLLIWFKVIIWHCHWSSNALHHDETSFSQNVCAICLKFSADPDPKPKWNDVPDTINATELNQFNGFKWSRGISADWSGIFVV